MCVDYLSFCSMNARISAAILQHRADLLWDEEHLVLTRWPPVWDLRFESWSQSEKNQTWKWKKWQLSQGFWMQTFQFQDNGIWIRNISVRNPFKYWTLISPYLYLVRFQHWSFIQRPFRVPPDPYSNNWVVETLGLFWCFLYLQSVLLSSLSLSCVCKSTNLSTIVLFLLFQIV